jgi:hypothetical protein
MLIAHLVPGYFAAVKSQPNWHLQWSQKQRIALWLVALGSTVAPDLDVIYNFLFRGFFGHTILWTHSIFPYLGLVLVWWAMRRIGQWPYLQTMIGLIAIGGWSHLLLDVVAHSTPLLYPFSMFMVGAPSEHVLKGRVWGYLTDPIFLLEPLLIAFAVGHWVTQRSQATPRLKKAAIFGLAGGCAVFSIGFWFLLPTLQGAVAGTLRYQAHFR